MTIGIVSCMHAFTARWLDSQGLLLGTEAPVMTPNAADFSFLYLSFLFLGWLQHSRAGYSVLDAETQ